MPFAQEQIEDALRVLCLSLDPRDYFDISEPIVNNIRIELPARARQLYRDMEREMFLAIGDSEVEALNAASRTTKCLQIANGAIYTDETGSAWAEVAATETAATASVAIRPAIHLRTTTPCVPPSTNPRISQVSQRVNLK